MKAARRKAIEIVKKDDPETEKVDIGIVTLKRENGMNNRLYPSTAFNVSSALTAIVWISKVFLTVCNAKRVTQTLVTYPQASQRRTPYFEAKINPLDGDRNLAIHVVKFPGV